jgi:amphi-Trp domain-containing protein
MRESPKEVALVLRRLAESLEQDIPVTLPLAGESVFVPAAADVRLEYESGAGARELTVRVSWGRAAAWSPLLIHRHGDQVRDSAGRLWDVLVYGEELADGTWEGWLQFAPRTAGLPSKRTGRETTQPDRASLEHWATGLEPLYLAGAFERAT